MVKYIPLCRYGGIGRHARFCLRYLGVTFDNFGFADFIYVD